MWTFQLTPEHLTIWYSTSSKHHLLATTVKPNLVDRLRKPKGFPIGLLQLDFPNDLFETIDIGLDSDNAEDYLFYRESTQRCPRDPQGFLMRLRPLMPIPYWNRISLEAPLFSVDSFPVLDSNEPTSERFIAHQTFKVKDFMFDRFDRILLDSNTGPVGITLKQIDRWRLSIADIKCLPRSRPLIIALGDNCSSLTKNKLYLNKGDSLSMSAQISLMRYVAARTITEFKYGDINRLRSLYADLILDGGGIGEVSLEFIDPFGLPLLR